MKTFWNRYRDFILAVLFFAFVAAAVIAGFAGCSTVHQEQVSSQQASYDQALVKNANGTVQEAEVQNSGILDKTSAGYIITAHFRDRYNALISIYGNAKLADGSPIFTPPITTDFGITPVPQVLSNGIYPGTVFLISNDGMEAMVVMSGLKRRGFKP